MRPGGLVAIPAVRFSTCSTPLPPQAVVRRVLDLVAILDVLFSASPGDRLVPPLFFFSPYLPHPFADCIRVYSPKLRHQDYSRVGFLLASSCAPPAGAPRARNAPCGRDHSRRDSVRTLMATSRPSLVSVAR